MLNDVGTITQKEYRLPDECVIISKTDVEGNITYCNEAFVEASGYTKEELLGQPHNILRHPDMPAPAFADLWRTVERGMPWNGMVKNRRKNGDHYWVYAQVSPTYSMGAINGYLSIRIPATPEQIQLAEQLYPALAQGVVKLNAGKVLTWHHRFNFLQHLNLGLVLVWFITLFGILPHLLGAFGIITLPSWYEVTIISFIGLFAYLGQKFHYDHLRSFADSLQALSERKMAIQVSFAADRSLLSAGVTHKIGALLRTMQLNLWSNMNSTEDALVAQQRIYSAMNEADAAFLVSDAVGNIVMANRAARHLMASYAGLLSTTCHGFNAREVIGQSVIKLVGSDNMHLVAHDHKSQQFILDVGVSRFEITASPILHDGHYLGMTVLLQDITKDLLAQQNIGQLVDAAQAGYMKVRLDLNNLPAGYYRDFAQRVNEMLDTFNCVFDMVGRSVGMLAFSDISRDIPGNYQGQFRMMQDAVNLSLRNMNELLGQVQYTAKQVESTIADINLGVMDFSEKLRSQSTSLQHTASNMQQISAEVQLGVEQMKSSASLTHFAGQQVEQSANIMDQAALAMEDIRLSGEKISEINTIIDGIAFQTNLLALNASVEAARAGEHGKGFAVVASEVRELAQKSAEAAASIQQLIEQSVAQIAHGTQLVQQSQSSMSGVLSTVSELTNSVATLNSTAERQAITLREVSMALDVIDQAVSNSTSLADATTTQSLVVSSRMQALMQQVASFKLSKQGQKVANEGKTLLADMKQAHLNWRIKIVNYLEGFDATVDPRVVGDYTACALGKWRASIGEQYAHLPIMMQVDEAHRLFHQKVAEIVDMHLNERDEEANRELVQIEYLSENVVKLLTELEDQIALCADSVDERVLVVEGLSTVSAGCDEDGCHHH